MPEGQWPESAISCLTPASAGRAGSPEAAVRDALGPIIFGQVRTGKTNALAQSADILETPRNRLSVRPKPRGTLTKPTHTVAVADLPAYDDEQRAIAEAALGAIPVDRVMLTYADITAWFGISRATIVRKVRAGLVPGIRFLHERVLEDGPVRRFTREKVRYLLLAVRCRMAAD